MQPDVNKATTHVFQWLRIGYTWVYKSEERVLKGFCVEPHTLHLLQLPPSCPSCLKPSKAGPRAGRKGHNRMCKHIFREFVFDTDHIDHIFPFLSTFHAHDTPFSRPRTCIAEKGMCHEFAVTNSVPAFSRTGAKTVQNDVRKELE